MGASPSPAPATAEPTVSTTPTTPDSPPPAGMDSVTATFLTTVCAASDDINRYTVPAFSGFPSVTDAQDAYVLVYAGRASAAQQATVGLQGLLPATIAGGRVDGAAIAANMGRLAKILSDGALALQALQPVTTQDVDTVAAEINRQAGTVPFMSMSVLTPQEQGWMTTLRGCRPAK